jgi:hypothetical protein
VATIAKFTVWVPDQRALHELLDAVTVQLECGAPARDADGRFVVTLYGETTEASKIEALGLRFDVDETFGAALKQRQREVSKRNRFEGGKLPEGLGIKR